MRVLYFAWLRQKTGVAEEEVVPPADVQDVRGLVEWLASLSPAHADAFLHRGAIRCAVNQDFATPDTRVKPDDEVAFFPPVTGG